MIRTACPLNFCFFPRHQPWQRAVAVRCNIAPTQTVPLAPDPTLEQSVWPSRADEKQVGDLTAPSRQGADSAARTVERTVAPAPGIAALSTSTPRPGNPESGRGGRGTARRSVGRVPVAHRWPRTADRLHP